MQGVSISILVKNAKRASQKQSGADTPQSKDGYAVKIQHAEIFGRRDVKYDFLNGNSLKNIEWNELETNEPYYFFVPKEFSSEGEYKKGFEINELFKVSRNGIETGRDDLFIGFDQQEVSLKIKEIIENKELLLSRYGIKDTPSFRIYKHIDGILFSENEIINVAYRPFDCRKIYYQKDLLRRSFYDVTKHMLKNNHSLILCRQQSTFDFQHCFITNYLTDRNSISLQTKEASYFFPLYLYPDKDELNLGEGKVAARVPNLNMEIVARFAEKIGLEFSPVGVHSFSVSPSGSPRNSGDQETNLKPHAEAVNSNEFTPEDLLDYIYAVLHSPNYREKYKEFLKIDFPRIPLPENADEFWKFVSKGCELRKLHLMESPELDKPLTSYPVSGSNVVDKVVFKECSTGILRPSSVQVLPVSSGISPSSTPSGKVFINSTQYFDGVPEISWNFYIGGYQPARKWLKDRKGRTLSYDDIIHYRKIITALKRTAEVMEEINDIRKF
jgi:predicted helicase